MKNQGFDSCNIFVYALVLHSPTVSAIVQNLTRLAEKFYWQAFWLSIFLPLSKCTNWTLLKTGHSLYLKMSATGLSLGVWSARTFTPRQSQLLRTGTNENPWVLFPGGCCWWSALASLNKNTSPATKWLTSHEIYFGDEGWTYYLTTRYATSRRKSRQQRCSVT